MDYKAKMKKLKFIHCSKFNHSEDIYFFNPKKLYVLTKKRALKAKITKLEKKLIMWPHWAKSLDLM